MSEELAAQSEKVKRIREELAEEMLKLAEAKEAFSRYLYFGNIVVS